MSRRKLQALEYPNLPNIDVQALDQIQFRNIVLWLEEQKIRQYNELEGRQPLRDTRNDQQWPSALNQYLNDLDLGWAVGRSQAEILDLLLSIAVTLEYAEEGKAEKFMEACSINVHAKKDQAPQIIAANPLDELDFSSPEFVKGVNALADVLRVTKHPNHLLTLEGCAKLVQTRYSKENMKNGENVIKKGSAFPFQEVDKSFESGDAVLNHAAKILRLLFIMDLRDLQTKINECIVAVQSITANPKTDTRLGKVGY
ncbi:RNA transcription, translation and transport factor protein [Folsomia candida]|uniref:RNA transcription, translation and transport factor protein n=1 Tax=Folsomia candida TaxID=158441 RepID=UPI000B904C71|nr:RNA transcription, translation and transport factor protein [Folsomia candida]